MLYDPKWEIETRPSLEGLIAWLETKDPNEAYVWKNCDGDCLIGQYWNSLGISMAVGSYMQVNGQFLYDSLTSPNGDDGIAITQPHTFGGALERACAALIRREQSK